MSRYRQLSAEERAAIKIAACQRVEAVWTCLGVLRPDLTPQGKKALAEKVFELSRGKDQKPPQIKITPAQVDKHCLGEHAVHPSPLPHAAVFKSDCRRTQRVL